MTHIVGAASELTAIADPKSHPAYREFASVVADVIAPRAAEVDRTEVPRSHIDALREVGYHRWGVPVAYGGLDVPEQVISAANELLFGADPSTATVVTQHSAPVVPALVAGSPQSLELLPPLAAGDLIGGAGMGHVRGWPRRRGTLATPVAGGYRIDGVIGWHSGWGLTDVIWLGAVDADRDSYVFGIADLHDPAITAQPLALNAVRGSRTVSLTLRGYFLPDALVSQVVPIETWKAEDGVVSLQLRRARQLDPSTAADAVPQVPTAGAYGLARAALDDALAAYPDEAALVRLSDELETLVREPLAEPAWRAALNELAVRATAVALVARGGAGLLDEDLAQIRARAALFLQVRGLAPAVRSAHFAAYSR
ncbi:MAG: acyl-CoA dehydrogenase family protein [Gordonia sp. (in: high G+C Gram-positive bacteria)]